MFYVSPITVRFYFRKWTLGSNRASLEVHSKSMYIYKSNECECPKEQWKYCAISRNEMFGSLAFLQFYLE